MSWVSDYKYTWLERIAMNVIKAGGHLPYHIAFVMDGNRRYASSQHIRKIDGHSKGFDKLADCLRWCLDTGIREVTTFAFSIENFKRSEDEVSGLLDLAREKFSKLIQETPKLHEYGVRIRVIGNLSLLPEDLQKLIAQAMLETESNNKLFLNVAFSYTSRDEMTQSIEAVLKHGDDLKENDISERLLEECLYSRHSPSPDLLFRTSGETRISDFLMWQVICPTDSLKPRNKTINHFYIYFSSMRRFCTLPKYFGQKLLYGTFWPAYFLTNVQTYSWNRIKDNSV